MVLALAGSVNGAGTGWECEWCWHWLGVCMVLALAGSVYGAGTGWECQDLLSTLDGMHVHTDETSVMNVLIRMVLRMESEPV